MARSWGLATLEAFDDGHGRGPEPIPALEWALREYQGLGLPVYARCHDPARRYLAFERTHIRREETEIIPLARTRLAAEDRIVIDAVFTENDYPCSEPLPRSEIRSHLTVSAAKLSAGRLEALELVAWPSSGRTSAVITCRI